MECFDFDLTVVKMTTRTRKIEIANSRGDVA
jgi:hypothetical protein